MIFWSTWMGEPVMILPGAEELDILLLWAEGLVILPTGMEVLIVIRPKGVAGKNGFCSHRSFVGLCYT